jgi:hypothetical protein
MVKKISLRSLDNSVKSAVESVISGSVYNFSNFATLQDLPISAQSGDLALVESDSRLYVFDGTNWVSSAPTTKNFFQILQIGSFTGPIVGDASYSPTRTITIVSIEAT